ncbi:MAG TPA: hypothetical protein VNL35_14870, partial [Chloroflexota bacterium]|nr:hypothetical protein [Chloroflexota bacterium]
FLRGGKEGDRHASLREIQHLFETQALLGPPQRSPWQLACGDAFVYLQQHIPTHGPFLGVALTPAFPIDPIDLDNEDDHSFKMLCHTVFHEHGGRLRREPDAVGFGWFKEPECNDHYPYARAFNDGSIGMRRRLYPGAPPPDQDHKPYPVNLVGAWGALWDMLKATSRWPWVHCGYEGPLTVHVGLGNLANTYVIIGSKEDFPLPDIEPNRLPGWSKQLEWDHGQRPEVILEAALPALARQLQFGEFAAIKHRLQAETAQRPWEEA